MNFIRRIRLATLVLLLGNISVRALGQTLQTVTDAGNYTTDNIWVGMQPISNVSNGGLNLNGKIKFLGLDTAFNLTVVTGNQSTIYRSTPGGSKYPFNNYDNLILQAGIQAHDIAFVTGASPSVSMVISGTTGNVGIGTVAPQSMLAVEGTITAKQLKVTLTGWSDFVFDSVYQIMPLDKISKYVAANKHLPQIPSASEIEEKGLDIGAMQKLQMQKIEDLTLYAIDADKHIKDQDDMLNQQQQLLIELRQEVDRLKRQIGKHCK